MDNLSPADITLIVGIVVSIVGIIKSQNDIYVLKKQISIAKEKVTVTDNQATADEHAAQVEQQRIINTAASRAQDLLMKRVDTLEGAAATNERINSEKTNTLQTTINNLQTTLNEAHTEIGVLHTQVTDLTNQVQSLTTLNGQLNMQLTAQNELIKQLIEQKADHVEKESQT